MEVIELLFNRPHISLEFIKKNLIMVSEIFVVSTRDALVPVFWMFVHDFSTFLVHFNRRFSVRLLGHNPSHFGSINYHSDGRAPCHH